MKSMSILEIENNIVESIKTLEMNPDNEVEDVQLFAIRLFGL